MKNQIIIQILLILICSELFAQWKNSLTISNTSEELIDLFFLDKSQGWAISDKKLYKTTNGGENWSQQNPPSFSSHGCIYFLDQNVGFIGSGSDLSPLYQTKIYKTTNGGGTWEEVYDDNNGYVNDFHFVSNSVGFAITKSYGSNNSEFYTTTDGGETWEYIYRFFTPYVDDIHFFNENEGLAATVGGLYSTSNGGETWTKILSEWLVSLSFVNNSIGYVLDPQLDNNGYCIYYKTTNQGTSWSENSFYIDSKSGYEFKRIFFINLTTGYIMGDDDQDNVVLYKTTNSGSSWTKQDLSSLDIKLAQEIYFFDNYTGYILSEKEINSYNRGVINCQEPSYDELLIPNELKDIIWTSINVDNVQISYSVDNKITWNSITNYTMSDGLYSWSVPNIPSLDSYIRIRDSARPLEVEAFSMKFKIKGIELTKPVGDENLWNNSVVEIEWNKVAIDTVLIEFTSNNASWISIDTVFTNTSTQWNIPNIISNLCRIKVSDFYDKDISFTSDIFSIIEHPEIKIVTPNGSEQWEANNDEKIVWSSTNVERVQLLYSTNNGLNWEMIASNIPASDSSYLWQVVDSPNEISLIKIIDQAHENVFDVSDSVFSILPQRILKILIPNGGEKWGMDSEQSIEWNSTSLSNIKLEFSINNGSDWILIDSLYSSTGIYKWTLPNLLSNNCKVKISDPNDLNFFDTSDSTFSIVDPTNILSGESLVLPSEFKLYQNFPNPFNTNTTISFDIPRISSISLKLYSIDGKLVKVIIDEENFSPGKYTINIIANGLPSGIYFYEWHYGNYRDIKKLTLIK